MRTRTSKRSLTSRSPAGSHSEGLVVFNRFYEPDIDPEELAVTRSLHLSDSSTLLLRLRWLAILSDRADASLAVTGGVHTGRDALRSVMAGAHAVQLVSAILRHGPPRLRRILDEMTRWFEEHEYESLEPARGSMNLLRSPDTQGYERANCFDIFHSWELDTDGAWGRLPRCRAMKEALTE